jgi:16S rRNA processing protein RimM
VARDAKPKPRAKPSPSPTPDRKRGKVEPRPADARPAARSPRAQKAAEPAPPRAKKPPRTDGMIAVAEVARPHGVQGELRLKVYNPDSDLLAGRLRVKLRLPDGTERDADITTARDADKALLVRFAGVDDRDAAEALRGAEVCVPREEFPALEDGEFYACDVEGARAVLPGGEEIGHVAGVATYPTCDVLLVERASGGRLEIPLLEPYVGKVDVAGGIVEILTIDGLE